MSISQVGSATSTNGTATSSLGITLPTGWAAQDAIYVVVFNDNGDATGHAATGWVDISGGDLGTSSLNLAVLRRIMQAGDSAPTVSWSGGNMRAVSLCIALRGVDTADPEDDLQSAAYTTSLNSTLAPAVTTTIPDCWILSFFGNANSRTGTPPSEQTELLDVSVGGNSPFAQLNIDTNPVSGTGSAGGRIETLSGNASHRIGLNIAVRPAAAAAAGGNPLTLVGVGG